MYWISDVIIDEKYRGQGLGKHLIQCIVEYEEFKGLTGILGTKDAHGQLPRGQKTMVISFIISRLGIYFL